MSRRRGRGHHHERARQPGPRPATSEPRAVQAAEHPAAQAADARPADVRPVESRSVEPPTSAAPAPAAPAAPEHRPVETGPTPQAPPVASNGGPIAANRGPAPRPSGPDRNTPCTAPQLRRFIKSRPYVPMHELRRRFAIETEDDDVNPIDLDPGRVFVGLPAREGQLLGELLRAGEVGYELSLDPRTPVVVGVYPMRPVPRP